jgi:hypothetical protein
MTTLTNADIISELNAVFTGDAVGNIDGLVIPNVTVANGFTAPISAVKITGATVDGQLLAANGTGGNVRWTTINAATGNIASLNLTGNGAQVLAGNGAWITPVTAGNVGQANFNGNSTTYLRGDGNWANIPIPTGNVANTNYTGNSSVFLNGAGQFITVPGSGGGNIGTVNLSGNTSTFLRGDGTFTAVPGAGGGNVGTANFNGNSSTYLRGDAQWAALPSTSNVPNLNGNALTWLNGAGSWSNIAVPSVGNIATLNLNGNGGQVLAGNGGWIPATASGNLGAANFNGNGSQVLTGAGGWVGYGNVAAFSFNGSSTQFLCGDGSWKTAGGSGNGTASGGNGAIQTSTGSGGFSSDWSNLRYDGSTFKAPTITTPGMLSLNYAIETVNRQSGAAPTGTYSYDILNGTVVHCDTAPLPASTTLILNVRGNSTVPLSSIVTTGNVVTLVYAMTTGSTAAGITQLNIDGAAQTIKWLGGSAPTTFANSTQFYTFSIMKLPLNYLVTGSMARYA